MGSMACLLWLQGISPEMFGMIPTCQALAGHGADVTLRPLPPAEPSACYYQTLTGMGPAKTGRFDAVRVTGYTVSEDTSAPDGAWHRLLPDLIARAGHTATLLDIDATGAAAPLSPRSSDEDCVIVRVRDAGAAGAAALDALVRECASLVGEDGHLLVMGDFVGAGATVPVNVNDFLADIGLIEVRGPARVDGEIAWEETLAYGFGAGQIRINMRGREPAGTVAPGHECDEVCDALVSALREDWRDPQTGEPVVESVVRKSEALPGEYLFKAPDLTIAFRPGYSASARAQVLQFDGQSVQATGDIAHRQTSQARLLASGPAFAPHRAEGRLIDLAPTILYLLGLPVPAHMDGRVLEAVIAPDHLAYAPVGAAQDDVLQLSADEEVAITDRLQALGYLG